MNRSNGRAGKWGIALALVLGFALASGPVSATDSIEDGPGTKFLECRDTAHSNYNECLVKATRESERYACDIAWGFDLIDCDMALVRAVIGWFKW
jgi:hypothetical protein